MRTPAVAIGLDATPALDSADGVTYRALSRIHSAIFNLQDELEAQTGYATTTVDATTTVATYYSAGKNSKLVLPIGESITVGSICSLYNWGGYVAGARLCVDEPVMFATDSYTFPAVGIFRTDGIIDTLSGLTPGALYYLDSGGAVTTTPGTWAIGRALSATQLLFKPYKV
jgi:hypothetical protein